MMKELRWPVFARLSWAQRAAAKAGTTVEGAPLATVRSVIFGLASHCGGAHDS
jgi:hypothetical protein